MICSEIPETFMIPPVISGLLCDVGDGVGAENFLNGFPTASNNIPVRITIVAARITLTSGLKKVSCCIILKYRESLYHA